MEDLLAEINNGGDFATIASNHTDAGQVEYQFGKGDMIAEFEAAAFGLVEGQVSGIVETPDGYYIIKCVNTFDREETDANKLKIMEKRKEEAFYIEYEGFVASLTRDLNDKLWEEVTFLHDEEVTTSSFFQIYDKYFAKVD